MEITSNSLTSINNHFSPNRMRDTIMTEDSPGEGIFIEKVERPPKKKLRMIKVPEKFEKTL